MPPPRVPALEEEILFNADSLLRAIAGVYVCEIGPRHSRQVVQEYFLQRVEETITALNRSHAAAGNQLLQDLDHDPLQEEEATQQSYATWFNARRLLAEASMSDKYFHHVLEDLERSERNMDLMTMSVPLHATPVPSHVSSEHLREKATIRRTYHSRVPAILRALPDEASPTSPNELSLPDLVDRLSELYMADHSSGDQ
ncbi:hypothetical protein FIBSPDRAFT_879023 [Athelia psychrophila]|uniref:Uncharacterized protein n=1 Tax=Athelia psychrophila TaxID=1759441 RepID=A0A167UFG7_9AGAM|nr:hypothetical protein FIBSPDRAFT_879023 [Fibularhizoctonia sp. CBS 109695]